MQSLISKFDSRFLPVGLFFICLVIVVLAFQQTLSGLLTVWLVFDESYGHGLLVAATSLVLTCRALVRTAPVSVSPNSYFAIPLVIAAVLIELATIVGVDLLQYLLLPVAILLAFALLAGTAQARLVIVPLALLYFAIPFWDYLNNGLVGITSVVVQYLVAHTGITAHITGNSIFIPSGEIIIASGCSGLRYLIIGTFLGVLSSYLNFTSIKRQLLLIAGLVLLSLLANWVRVYGITIVAYVSEMQSPLVNDHEFLGWVLFMAFMMPLLYLNSRYAPAAPIQADTAITTNTGGVDPLARRGSRKWLRIGIAFALLCLSVAIHPYLLEGGGNSGLQPTDLPDISAPFRNGWQETAPTPDRLTWQPRIAEADNVSVKQYVQGPDSITVYQYLYVRTGPKDEILPYISNLHDRDNWVVNESGNLHGYRLLELANKSTDQKVLVVYRFNVGGFMSSSYLFAKLYQFPAVMMQRPYALVTAAATSCPLQCDSARVLLAAFLNGR